MNFNLNKNILNFRIKVVSKEVKEEIKHNSTSLITGIVDKDENNNYIVIVKNTNNSKEKETSYEFTKNSYDLYDKTVIYSIERKEKGYIAIVRSHNDAKLIKGASDFYVPFKPGIKVKGKLININGVKKFNLVSVCNPESYTVY